MVRLRYVHVYFRAEEARKIIVNLRRREERVALSGLELMNTIDVPVGPEVLAEDGTA